MVESFWTRLTSPVTGLAGGTYKEMKAQPSFNPFSEEFGSLSKIKWGIGAIVVILIVVAVVYVGSQLLIAGTATKTAYRSVRKK